jgi:signal transduction histidine kinase
MGAATKAELEAMVKRLERSLEQSQAKNVMLVKSLDRAKTKNVAIRKLLEEAHEREKATSEILKVISSSPTDTRPVFDAIVGSGSRLFGGAEVGLNLRQAGELASVASNVERDVPVYARSAEDESFPGVRAMVRQEVVDVPDFLSETWVSEQVRERVRRIGRRAVTHAPLLSKGKAIGTINVSRAKPGPLAPQQVTLLKTFADQAVIAIENVRLFKELEVRNAEVTEALRQQTATAEILRAISSSPTDTQPVFDTIAANAARLCAARDAQVLRVESEVLRLVSASGAPSIPPVRSISRGYVVGRAVIDRQTIHVPDIDQAIREFPETSAPQHAVHSILAIPLLQNDGAVGVIRVSRTQIQPFTSAQIALLQTFADQAVIAIENVRLFKEIQDKSRQLEIANQHKSEFLANMSHELRTPLNAVIGFSEVLQQGMVGELNEKQGEYINYIHTSGSHLLSLINDILDLSKVEAGRMELDLSTFSVPMAIDNALTLIKERATRHGLALECSLDPAVAEINADERKFKQILLNLLSNAVKFTPENGCITVSARAIDGTVEVSVADTGIGIAPEDCEAVFEEFRQVGERAERKAEGTGLGLALTKKFIELHGGKIWLTSTIGQGSTFFFTLPKSQPKAQTVPDK